MQKELDLDTAESLVAAVDEAMDVVSTRRTVAPATSKAHSLFSVDLEIAGRLRLPAEKAFDLVTPGFRELGHIALFRRRAGEDLILAVPGAVPKTSSGSYVAIGLFIATLLSVLWMGAENERLPGKPLDWLSGVPFAASLMGILLAHEMGHYLMARRLGTPASLPYFIPLPGLSIFGTMGAVMQMKFPPRNRRALLAVGAAGPVAGLVVAIPVLLWGLHLSQVMAIPADAPTYQEGNSLLYLGLKFLLFGRVLPFGGEDVFLHPMALAGWAGLLVTALNLIPAGQLDGGHIAYALFGERARQFSWTIIVGLAALSILWQGWLLWAVVVYFFGRVNAVPLDDITRLRPSQRWFAIALLIVAVLVFVPEPMVVHIPGG
ncbi:MAG: site-2 protease family protein [Chloroflexota bacterium]